MMRTRNFLRLSPLLPLLSISLAASADSEIKVNVRSLEYAEKKGSTYLVGYSPSVVGHITITCEIQNDGEKPVLLLPTHFFCRDKSYEALFPYGELKLANLRWVTPEFFGLKGWEDNSEVYSMLLPPDLVIEVPSKSKKTVVLFAENFGGNRYGTRSGSGGGVSWSFTGQIVKKRTPWKIRLLKLTADDLQRHPQLRKATASNDIEKAYADIRQVLGGFKVPAKTSDLWLEAEIPKSVIR